MASSSEPSKARKGLVGQEKKAYTGTLLLSGCLASLGSFNFGYNLSVVNTPARTFASCAENSSVWDCFVVDSVSWGFVAGIMCAGALLGSLGAGWVTDRIGRRKSIIWANAPFVFGLGIISLAMNFWMLLVGRFFIGIGVGAACIVVPLYLTEISTLAARGFIGTLHQMGIVVGILMAEIMGYLGLYRPFYWRFMFAFNIIPCIIQIFGMILFSPESPRYLMLNGFIDEAGRSLAKLRRKYYSDEERDNMLRSCESNQQHNESWSLTSLFITHRREAAKSLMVAVALHLGQQLSGINTILLFSDSIFNTTIGESSEPSIVPLLITILNLLMTIVAVVMIDRAGRRLLALISSFGIFISSAILTIAFVNNWRMVSIISVLVFVSSFAVGMGPIPWLMTNEIFPTHAVGSAVAFAVGLNWIANLTVTVTFPPLLKALNDYAFIPYSMFMLAFFIFGWFMLPETRGRPLAFIS